MEGSLAPIFEVFLELTVQRSTHDVRFHETKSHLFSQESTTFRSNGRPYVVCEHYFFSYRLLSWINALMRDPREDVATSTGRPLCCPYAFNILSWISLLLTPSATKSVVLPRRNARAIVNWLYLRLCLPNTLKRLTRNKIRGFQLDALKLLYRLIVSELQRDLSRYSLNRIVAPIGKNIINIYYRKVGGKIFRSLGGPAGLIETHKECWDHGTSTERAIPFERNMIKKTKPLGPGVCYVNIVRLKTK